uniref:Uncharacterized protein n=1 Tax=Anopheles melas TaxID=34690 RepID=A0A182U3Z9_9DIPT
MRVYTSHEESRTTTDNLISSSLTLRLHLQSSHFGTGLMPGLGGASGSGGALLLRCTATIGKLYERYTELELGVPQRDPIPARVTSSGGGRILPSPAGSIVGCRNLWMLVLVTLALVLHNNHPSLAQLSRPLVPLVVLHRYSATLCEAQRNQQGANWEGGLRKREHGGPVMVMARFRKRKFN